MKVFQRLKRSFESQKVTSSALKPKSSDHTSSSQIQLNLSRTAIMGTGESGLFSEVAIVERFKQESMYGLSAERVAFLAR